MMIRPRLLIALLSVLLISPLISAESVAPESSSGAAGLHILVAEEQKGLHIQPRSIQLAVFMIENRTLSPVTVKPEFTLPVGWTPIMPSLPVTIPGEGTIPVYFSYQVPDSALGGEQEITCTISLPEGNSIQGTLYVSVDYVYDLQLTLMKTDPYVSAGESYAFDMILKNESNIDADLTIEISEEKGYSVNTGQSIERISLTPQEVILITATVSTPDDITVSEEHTIQVRAGIIGQEAVQEKELTIELIPSVPGESVWHTYPLTVKTNSILQFEDDTTMLNSIAISGSGSLLNDGSHLIDFSLTPPIFPSSEFSIFDTDVSVSYEQEHLYLYGGTDRAFPVPGVSGGTGLGIGMKLSIDEFSVQGALIDQEDELSAATFGTGIEYTLFGSHELSIGYIAPLDDPGTGTFGIKDRFFPYGTADLYAEFMMYPEDPEAFRYEISASEARKKYKYSLRREYSSPAYAEDEYGTDSYSLNGTLMAFSSLRLSAGFEQYMSNLRLSQSSDTAHTNQTLLFSAYWLPVSNISITIKQKAFRQWNLLETDALDTTIDTTSMNISYQRKWLTLRPSVSISRTRLIEDGAVFTSLISGLSSDFIFSQRTRISSSIDYDTGSNDAGVLDSLLSGTLSISVNPNSYISAYAGCSMTVYPYIPSNTSFGLRAGMTFQEDTVGTVAFNSQYALSPNSVGTEPEVSVTVSYTKPFVFDIPISLRRDIGSVEGIVFDQESGMPLQAVLVRIGDLSVLTDADGQYSFKAVSPGEHKLEVSAPEYDGFIVAGAYPVPMTIEEGENLVIDIPMTEKAMISGKVARFEMKPGTGTFFTPPEFLEEGGFSGLVVEISSEHGVRREATRTDGTFVFSSVIPGDMTIRVFTDSLPDSHELEEHTRDLQLEPGERRIVDFDVMPIVRQIKFVQEGVITID